MALAGVWQGVRMDLNLLEIAAIATGCCAWRMGGWRPKWNRIPDPRSPALWAIGVAVGVVLIRLALLPVLHAPAPIVADEFSHLLLADTLAHGRLVNATHPFWPHFESLHIIQQPHYVSNYFPGPAVVLAVARVAVGNPWAGILAECAAFLAILYWSLRGWMPARWGLFGVILAALRFGIGSYWINAFHGGFLPAIGGALVFGAFARLRRRASLVEGALLGIGLLIMVLSRPYEGVLYSLPILAALGWEHRKSFKELARITIPVAVFAGLAALLLVGYMKQVSGSPFVSAYQISQKTYGWPLGVAWSTIPAIQHRHVELQTYYEYEVSEREKVDGPLDFLEYLTLRLQEYWRFFIGPILTIPLLFLPRVWKRRKLMFLALSGALFAVMLEGAASPHYIAVATAAIVAIVVECTRHLRAARWGLAGALPFALGAVLVVRIGAQSLHLPYTQTVNYQSWCCRVEGNLNKVRVSRELMARPGSHLVFVRAKTDWRNFLQWIYNDADIDRSRIVWARDLGEARNAELVDYYKGTREVWMLDPNVEPARIERYLPLPKPLLHALSH
jgi:hypothetical protein